MRLELYYAGTCVFATDSDVLPEAGCSIVFRVAAATSGLRPGELATAIIDPAQPPLEFDFSDGRHLVTRVAVRDLQKLVPV